ncbi:class I SAM-dependent methyltransferase (plasmid) [Rhodococcus aetherivorans]|uniref:class I SAM-dependent methyltransferase n=1 Tax=Rhodococcus aetherivorans TaxID=191292 RepID=UPI0026EFDFAA|nr:class I SAM-dependent methyltransferase [Rhodococcus aetherivorans]WKX02037.1 class I SAM-dependent methyltransferase [Rhodococcus aetherivorans]
MARDEVTQAEKDGAALYNRAALAVYDTLVLRWSNGLVWGCPTERLLAHYDRHLGGRHLDIGPGTGWYLQNATYPTPKPEITLMDLNPATMEVTSRRLAEREIAATAHTGSILAPIDIEQGPFDSVAANFVMHCVPGAWQDKGVAFGHIADVTADDGVFFGSTILGRGVTRNLAGKVLSTIYNDAAHIFSNSQDDRGGLEAALEGAFEHVGVQVIGTVAVFAARGPRRHRAGR